MLLVEFISIARFVRSLFHFVQQMWPDFIFWWEQIVEGRRFRARISYSDFDRVKSSDLRILSKEESDEALAAPTDWA